MELAWPNGTLTLLLFSELLPSSSPALPLSPNSSKHAATVQQSDVRRSSEKQMPLYVRMPTMSDRKAMVTGLMDAIGHHSTLSNCFAL